MSEAARNEVPATSAVQAWWLAARPRTLLVSVGPVAVGTALAASGAGWRAGPAFAALLGAMLLQLGSNFANDVYDHEKGADTDERIGPLRAVQLGLLSPAQMRRGMAVVFAAATCVGLYLSWVAGWPVVAIGLLSIATAVAYTGGPWPLGYHGLGDVAVFIFFGVVAVMGTEYVQTLSLSVNALLASLSVGALATATLVVNNVRDIETDRVAGKNTLAVRLGRHGGRIEYAALIAFPYLMLPVFWMVCERSVWVWVPLATLPRAVRLLDVVFRSEDGPSLNTALAGTAQLGLFYSLLLAVGWWI